MLEVARVVSGVATVLGQSDWPSPCIMAPLVFLAVSAFVLFVIWSQKALNRVPTKVWVVLIIVSLPFILADYLRKDPRREFKTSCEQLDAWFTRGGVDDPTIASGCRALGDAVARIKESKNPSVSASELAQMERLADEAERCGAALSEAARSPSAFREFERSRNRMKSLLREYLVDHPRARE